MKNAIMNLVKREEGQTMAEYGIILAVIAIVVAVVAVTLGADIAGVFTDVSAEL